MPAAYEQTDSYAATKAVNGSLVQPTEHSRNGHAEIETSSLNGAPTTKTNGVISTCSCSMHNDDKIPVIIVGAGPVGLLLALRLAQSNIPSVVLEKQSTLDTAPRAIGYYGPVHKVFEEAGIYEQVAREGMPSGGYVWRKLPVDDEDSTGSKKLGPIIGENIMAHPDSNGRYELGHYSIQLSQNRLCEILLEEARKTSLVDVYWDHCVTDLAQDSTGVTVTIESPHHQHSPHILRAAYLTGCDGGKSHIRKLLGIRLSGHTWPERFVATDILRTAPIVAPVPVHFVVDPHYWAVVTPLEHVRPNTRGLWRYSMAVTDSSLTDEQVIDPAHVDSLLLKQLDGPRPSDHKVLRKSLYKMHQLLASSMHRGRCFLAGDAAHINNPIGGLGLCTGLLDADALHQTLEFVLKQQQPPLLSETVSGSNIDTETLFARYSAERRRIFQNIIHPFSSANKTRLHGAEPDDTARDDWYFQALRQRDPFELERIHRPLYEEWRTDMRAIAARRVENEKRK